MLMEFSCEPRFKVSRDNNNVLQPTLKSFILLKSLLLKFINHFQSFIAFANTKCLVINSFCGHIAKKSVEKVNE